MKWAILLSQNVEAPSCMYAEHPTRIPTSSWLSRAAGLITQWCLYQPAPRMSFQDVVW